MPETIGARCFTCGHVVRVLAKYGGQKAKCPNCNGIITIPTPWDSTMGIVPDTELPQVALEPVEPEAGAPPVEAPAEEEPPPPRGPTARRTGRVASARGAPGQRSAREGGLATNRRGAPEQKSNAGVIVAVVIAGLVVLVGAFVLLSRNNAGGSTKKHGSADDAPAKTQVDPAVRQAEVEVADRLKEFVRAFNDLDPKKIAAFYPASRNKDVLRFFAGEYESAFIKYERVEIPSLKATPASTVMYITFDRILLKRSQKIDQKDERVEEKGQRRTINWTKADGVWRIADNPEK